LQHKEEEGDGVVAVAFFVERLLGKNKQEKK